MVAARFSLVAFMSAWRYVLMRFIIKSIPPLSLALAAVVVMIVFAAHGVEDRDLVSD